MRFKNRYLLIEIKANNTLATVLEDQNDFICMLKNALQDTLGTIVYAQVFSSFKIIYYNMTANYLILRISRDYFRLLKQCLFFVRSIKETDVRFHIVFTTGTIRSAEKKLMMFLKENEHKGLKKLFDIKDVAF